MRSTGTVVPWTYANVWVDVAVGWGMVWKGTSPLLVL